MEGLPVQRAVAAVDLAAIERNCARLKREVGEGVRLCAVVKADGYGHGALEVARAALAGGAEVLATATASEAWELRQRLPEAELLVMGALSDAEIDVALQAAAEVAVWRRGFLEEVAARAASFGLRPRVHVKYDTGMGRLGERDPGLVGELVEAVLASERVEAAGLWTHFATADEEDPAFMEEQLERFCELALPLRERYPELALHAANSAATLREPRAHLDMVRCGIAIYGLDPYGTDPAERGLRPALTLASYVAAVKRFEDGASAGYGRRWRAGGERMVGVLPIGYGDGVRRGLSNNAEVLIGGRRYPLVGAVSMDNLTVDLGPATEVREGETAILIGEQDGEWVLAEEWAQRLETINYEVTCGITSRVPRLHLGRRPAPRSS